MKGNGVPAPSGLGKCEQEALSLTKNQQKPAGSPQAQIKRKNKRIKWCQRVAQLKQLSFELRQAVRVCLNHSIERKIHSDCRL